MWYCLSVIQAAKVRHFLEFKHLSQSVMQIFIHLGVSRAVFVVVIVQNLSVYFTVRLGSWTFSSARYIVTLMGVSPYLNDNI